MSTEPEDELGPVVVPPVFPGVNDSGTAPPPEEPELDFGMTVETAQGTAEVQ
ncbi:hypothetical protein [Streptomyces sp. NRRL F-5135]|uniref:hypothetical protein n=1 Tax=Streptomyces sp. NRRL F-5135 TaxID=1463858 RepID=UPI00131B340F|nr:hypothetical protein [Streptomyces sp. NRRL F-5135]